MCFGGQPANASCTIAGFPYVGLTLGWLNNTPFLAGCSGGTADSNVESTYAMAGYARADDGSEFVSIITVEKKTDTVTKIDLIDAVHSVNGRIERSARSATMAQGNPSSSASEITISELLDHVKETFPSILSDDVLSHYGISRNANGYYTSRVKHSTVLSRDLGDSDLVAANRQLRKDLSEMRAKLKTRTEQS